MKGCLIMNHDKVKKDGKKKTKVKKQALKEEVLAEEITQLQSIGLLRDVDPEKKPSEVLESIKDERTDMVEYDNEQSLIAKRGKGKYRLDDKLLALLFLEVYQKDMGGKMTPNYSLVSKWFDYPRQTLQGWWETREKIQQQTSSMNDKIMGVIRTRMGAELIRITESFARTDYDAMKDSDKIVLFNTLINKIRLMSNLSTNNVEHKHQGGVQLVMPQDN